MNWKQQQPMNIPEQHFVTCPNQDVVYGVGVTHEKAQYLDLEILARAAFSVD